MVAVIMVQAVALAAGLVIEALAYRASRPSGRFAAWTVGASVALLMPVAGVRPAMVGAIMSAGFLACLEWCRVRSRYRLLWLLPLLEVAWANLHGSYLIGLALFGLYPLGALVGQPDKLRELRRWLLPGAALAVAPLLNPRGPELVRFTILASRLSFNRHYVVAWQPPQFQSAAGVLVAAALASSVIVLALLRPRVPVVHVVLFLGASLGVLWSMEFLPLFAIVVPLVVFSALDDAISLSAVATWVPVFASTALAAAVVLMLCEAAYELTPEAYGATMAKYFPVECTQYLKTRGIVGPVFNDFDWGGYLLMADPDLSVFVDSRTELYGDRLLTTYLATASGDSPARSVLNGYGIRTVLIKPRDGLAKDLLVDPGWTLSCDSGNALLFTRS